MKYEEKVSLPPEEGSGKGLTPRKEMNVSLEMACFVNSERALASHCNASSLMLKILKHDKILGTI